jgi:AcrR family transcriptional regulator
MHARAAAAQKTRERIVDAAIELFVTRWYDEVTLREVASRSGVSLQTVVNHFGSKERLLAEVVRRDTDLRMAALDEQLARASNAADFIELLRATLEDMVRQDSEFLTLSFEVFTLSRRNEDIAAEFAELVRRTREQVAAVLAAKQAEGVLTLHAEPEAIAEVLFGLGDGLALRILGEPDRDHGATVAAGVLAISALIS